MMGGKGEIYWDLNSPLVVNCGNLVIGKYAGSYEPIVKWLNCSREMLLSVNRSESPGTESFNTFPLKIHHRGSLIATVLLRRILTRNTKF